MHNLKKELLIIFRKFKSGGGYTLIEIIVAIGIFTLMLAAPTGFFVSSLKGQQRALSSQGLIDNVSYNLEYISRAIRMAKKELNCGDQVEPSTCFCLKNNGYGFNYETTRGGKGIKFINYQDICQEFFWDVTDNRLKKTESGGEPVVLTSDELEVLNFKIGPTESWDQNNDNQPLITLFLEIKAKGSVVPESQPKIQIQTTISQRNLDVQY